MHPFARRPRPRRRSRSRAPVRPVVAPPAIVDSGVELECQLAHGSGVGRLHLQSGCTMDQLYEKLAAALPDIAASDILFCTLNTDKIDLDRVFVAAAPGDTIFAHLRGEAREVRLKKSEAAIGLTISDNGAGKNFVKRLIEDSLAAREALDIKPGDYLETVNGESMEGRRHFEVALFLRRIHIGEEVRLRVVSPRQSGFNFIGQRSGGRAQPLVEDGLKTLRFRPAGGAAVVEATASSGPSKELLVKINEVFETYLGVQDEQLALAVWEEAERAENLLEMSARVRQSELNAFDFPDELIFDLYGLVGDERRRRDSVSP